LRRGPQAVYGICLFVGHVLGLGGHVLGVLSGLSSVRKVHVHGLGSVAQDLVELEGFGTDHSRGLLLGFSLNRTPPERSTSSVNTASYRQGGVSTYHE
jgi:hypothetical protein